MSSFATQSPRVTSEFCFLDDIKTGIGRDALQNFALLSGQEDESRGRILRASKALSRLFDYNFDSPHPQDLSVFWGKSTDLATIKAIELAISTGSAFSGNIQCYKSGVKKPMWCEFNIGPVERGVTPGLVCFALFVRNIDVVKRGIKNPDLEADHLEQSKVTRRALNNTAIIEPIKRSKAFQYGSTGEGDGFAAMCGYKKYELMGKPLSCLYGNDTASSDRRVLHRALLDHDPLSCDMLCYKQDGTPFWRHCLAVPIADGAYLTFNLNVTRARRYVGSYMVGSSIGKGSFGTVKLGMHKKTGKEVALKRIKTEGNTRITRLVKNEIAIQQKLDSEYIARLFEVMTLHGMTYMIMELVPEGSLFERVVSKGGVPEDQALDLFLQVAQAVEWCHLNYVCHRDLKPENMLMYESGKIKLIDFGLSAFYTPGTKLRDVCGSKRFQAPEMMKRLGKGYDPELVDVWSLGVVLFEIFHGQIRLSQSDADSTAQYIRSYFNRWSYGDTPRDTGSPDAAPSATLRDFMFRLIEPEPEKRITLREMFEDPWLAEVDALEEAELEERLSKTAIDVQERLSRLEMEEEVVQERLSRLEMEEEAADACAADSHSESAQISAPITPMTSPSSSRALSFAEPEPAAELRPREKLPAIKSASKPSSKKSSKSSFLGCGSSSKSSKASTFDNMGRFVVGKKKKSLLSSSTRSHMSITSSALGAAPPGSTWSMAGSCYDGNGSTIEGAARPVALTEEPEGENEQ